MIAILNHEKIICLVIVSIYTIAIKSYYLSNMNKFLLKYSIAMKIY